MAINDILLRAVKGNELTHEEMDTNFVSLNRKLWISAVAPIATNDASQGFLGGAIWINITTNGFYKCTNNLIANAVWEVIPVNQVKDKFTQLTDTPSAFIANKYLQINALGTAVIQVDLPAQTDPVIGSVGITADRPVVGMIGYFYKDTTLGIPIWWDGTNWINHLGTTV